MSEEVIHRNITVTGRVQGVFYRASTRDKAHELDLVGFVKNQLDGNVYIEVEGSVSSVNALISWCHQGPTYSHVESVLVEEDQVQGFTKFEIRS